MVKFNFKLPKYFNEYKDYINNYYNLNATNEIWKVIQENTDYEISNYGRVRSKNNGLLKPMLNNKGYLRVTIFVRYTIKHVKGHQFCYAKDYIKPN